MTDEKNIEVSQQLIVNLWPPAKADWSYIIKMIESKFPVLEKWQCEFVGTDIEWTEFIVSLYMVESKIKPDMDVYDRIKHKAEYFFTAAAMFITLVIAVKNSEDVDSLIDLKRYIRTKLRYLKHYKRWSIIHTFEPHQTPDGLRLIRDSRKIKITEID